MSAAIRTSTALLLLLTACSTAELPEDTNQIQEEWTKGIQRLGQNLTAVYPPSEDYQVGDVYGVGQVMVDGRCPGPEEMMSLPTAKRPRLVRLGTASVDGLLDDTMKGRYLLPNGRAKDNTLIAEEPDTVEGPGKRDKGIRPVPLVAFPGFRLASGKVAKFGGTFAASLFGLVFGGASRSDVSLEVTVNEGETYGLTSYAARQALANFCSSKPQTLSGAQIESYPCSPSKIADAIAATYLAKTCGVYVTMVSRVYLSRSLKYGYSFDSISAFEAAIAAQKAASAEAVKTRATALGDILKLAAVKNGTSTDFRAAMDDLLAGLGDDLGKLGATGANGGFVSFGSYDGSTISLNQTFKRPLVFAYGGISYQVDELGRILNYSTGDVIAMSPLGGGRGPMPVHPTIPLMTPAFKE